MTLPQWDPRNPLSRLIGHRQANNLIRENLHRPYANSCSRAEDRQMRSLMILVTVMYTSKQCALMRRQSFMARVRNFTNKGDFCLIGLSNLEFHWLIHWNLVNSFELREGDCQLCHTWTVAFLVSSFLFVYAIMTRFYMEESFSTKRKSWEIRPKKVQNLVSKKTSIRRHET